MRLAGRRKDSPESSRASARTSDRPAWFDSTLLGLTLFIVYLLCANYSGRQINDNLSAFTAAWTLGQHGTLDVSLSPATTPWTVAVDGGLYSDRAPGLIVWVAGFYALLGRPDLLTAFPAGVAAAASAALAMGLMHSLFRRLASPRTALLAILVVAFGTATWTISADAVWPHGPDQVWLTSMLIALSSGRLWLAGLASAAALVTRPITATAIAATGIWASWQTRSLKPALRIGLVAGLGLLLFAAYNRAVFGAWTISPGSYGNLTSMFTGDSEVFDPTNPRVLATNIAGVFVSPTRGVLVLSPFLLALAPGLRHAWRAAPPWVRASAVGAGTYALVHGYGHNFAGGAGFYSYRYAIEPLTLLSPLLLLAWRHWTSLTRTRRTSFAILAVVAVTQHAAGALYGVPRVDPVTYDSWRHFLFTEALSSGGPLRAAFVGTAAAAASLAAVAAARQRDAPVTARSTSPVCRTK